MYGTRPLTVWRRIEGEVSRQIDGRSAEDRRLSIPPEQPDDLQGAWSSVQAGDHRDALIFGCDFNGHQAG